MASARGRSLAWQGVVATADVVVEQSEVEMEAGVEDVGAHNIVVDEVGKMVAAVWWRARTRE